MAGTLIAHLLSALTKWNIRKKNLDTKIIFLKDG